MSTMMFNSDDDGDDDGDGGDDNDGDAYDNGDADEGDDGRQNAVFEYLRKSSFYTRAKKTKAEPQNCPKTNVNGTLM